MGKDKEDKQKNSRKDSKKNSENGDSSAVTNQPGRRNNYIEDESDEEEETDYFKIHYDEFGNWKTHDWSSDVFECTEDKRVCLCSLIMPWYIGCLIAEKMEESCWVPLVVPGGYIAMRTKLRHRDYIYGSICDDFCCVYFCCPLALCQMYRHAFKDVKEKKLRAIAKEKEEAEKEEKNSNKNTEEKNK